MATTQHTILGVIFEIDNDTLKVISPDYDKAETVLGEVTYTWADIRKNKHVVGAIFPLLTEFEVAGKIVNAVALKDAEKEFYFGDADTLELVFSR